MTLGHRIADAIKGSGKTKAQVARDCEVTAGAVSQWLSGEVKSLKAETALALEHSTGYRAYWLLHGKGPKTLAEPVITWPFQKVAPERFERLDAGDRGYVERVLLKAIEECERYQQADGLVQNDDAATVLADTASTVSKSLPPSPAHHVQKQSGRERDPAFEKALRNAGGAESAGSKSVGVQKQRGRGRV